MGEEASFHMFFEKDDHKLLGKRKVSSDCEEGEAHVEFVSKVEEYYHQFFYQAFDMVFNSIRNRFPQKDYIDNGNTAFKSVP